MENDKYYRAGLDPTYVLGSPWYIDPLYRPYYTNYNKSPYVHPSAIPTKYPYIDPYRRFMGKGLIHRTQYNALCPPGFEPGIHNECVPLQPESWGTFYTKDSETITPLMYSNDKIPSNVDVCAPLAKKDKIGRMKRIGRMERIGCMTTKQGVLVANGYDDKDRTNVMECYTSYFW